MSSYDQRTCDRGAKVRLNGYFSFKRSISVVLPRTDIFAVLDSCTKSSQYWIPVQNAVQSYVVDPLHAIFLHIFQNERGDHGATETVTAQPKMKNIKN